MICYVCYVLIYGCPSPILYDMLQIKIRITCYKCAKIYDILQILARMLTLASLLTLARLGFRVRVKVGAKFRSLVKWLRLGEELVKRVKVRVRVN